MSLEDLSFNFQDRRDEVPPRIVIVITNVPLELTTNEVRYILDRLKDRMMDVVQTKRPLIPIERLRELLGNGTITKAQYDLLTQ